MNLLFQTCVHHAHHHCDSTYNSLRKTITMIMCTIIRDYHSVNAYGTIFIMLLTVFADKTMKVNLLVIIAVTLVHSTIGDNIQLLCNQGVSHCNEMSHIGQGLIERGHSLFIMLQDRMDEWYKQSVRDRNISILENRVGDGVPVLASDESTKNMMDLALTLTFREQYLACGNIFSAICNAMLEDEDLARQFVDTNITHLQL